jgi:hypothetical protein
MATTLKLTGLQACIEDAAAAWRDTSNSPPLPSSLAAVISKLSGLRNKLPAIYRESYFDPLLKTLGELTQAQWKNPNWHDFLSDLAQSVVQQAEGYEALATDAFQEVISDLYDGYLSASDRQHIKPPDFSIIPPLVRWGTPDFGPYTYGVDDFLHDLGFGAGMVSLPPSNANKGLMAWAALPHETGGHDILSADQGLLAELEVAVRSALKPMGDVMADYWGSRMSETGADVLGVLNAGPVAAIGLVAYFRGINDSLGNGPHLSPDGRADDSHPGDLVRAYLGAACVRLLKFKAKTQWAKLIEAEADKEPGVITLAGTVFTRAQVKKAVTAVAKAILKTKMQTLEDHSLDSIQNWQDDDEATVAEIRLSLLSGAALSPVLVDQAYATHVLAAACYSALQGAQTPIVAFDRMLPLLKTMHDNNPSWGPLFLRHPGNLRPHFAVDIKNRVKTKR